MTVALPAAQWPAELLEQGPQEDPTILLAGNALIGGTTFRLTAVRVDQFRFGPDFRPDVNRDVYTDYELSRLLDSLADVTEIVEAPTVTIGGGRYILWMLPAQTA